MSESQTLKQIVLPIFPMGSVIKEELLNRTHQLIQPRLQEEGGDPEGALQWMVSAQQTLQRFWLSDTIAAVSSNEPPTQECPEKRKQHQPPNTNGHTLTSVAAPY